MCNETRREKVSVKRKIRYFLMETIDWVQGRKNDLAPSRELISFVGGGFKEVGEEFLKHFIELAALKPHEKVLDVGCGVGRMAVPLTTYLNESGHYEGFDIFTDGINWCSKNISTKYPNFHFQLADIYNKQYNPQGNLKASEYKFPFENESFDFVFLVSVFTHILPEDMENYLCEIARVLKKGKRCFATFFLINKESSYLISAKKSTINFAHELGKYCVNNQRTPEAAVGYKEEFVLGIYEKYNLKIMHPVYYGSWCGRQNFLSFQDVIIALKDYKLSHK